MDVQKYKLRDQFTIALPNGDVLIGPKVIELSKSAAALEMHKLEFIEEPKEVKSEPLITKKKVEK